MNTILTFDPGETTGFAQFEYNRGTGGFPNTSTGFRLVAIGQIPWGRRFDDIEALIKSCRTAYSGDQIEAIIIEAFFLYPHRAWQQSGSVFPSSQVIGIIETFAYCQQLIHKVVKQNAGEITRVAVRPEHQIQMLSEHMRDAYKHGRLWLIKHQIEGAV